jgi:hypothetical protein
MNSKEEVYKMKIHDSLMVKCSKDNDVATFDVLRVPGGWIYNQYSVCDVMTSTFVPFSDKNSHCNLNH